VRKIRRRWDQGPVSDKFWRRSGPSRFWISRKERFTGQTIPAGVLVNLINNGSYAAHKRAEQGKEPGFEPTLRLSTRNLGDQVEIRVRDNSTGIPAAVRDKCQRYVGASVGGPTRRHLQDRVAADAKVAAIDGRSESGTARGGR
jgi:hypothetical protein